jgi:hypothetical protein
MTHAGLQHRQHRLGLTAQAPFGGGADQLFQIQRVA